MVDAFFRISPNSCVFFRSFSCFRSASAHFYSGHEMFPTTSTRSIFPRSDRHDGTNIRHTGEDLKITKGLLSKRCSTHKMSDIEPAHRLEKRTSRFWITLCLVSILFVLLSPKSAPSTWPATALSVSQLISVTARSPLVPVESRASEPEFDTSQVNFDNYSLILRGQRVLL